MCDLRTQLNTPPSTSGSAWLPGNSSIRSDGCILLLLRWSDPVSCRRTLRTPHQARGLTGVLARMRPSPVAGLQGPARPLHQGPQHQHHRPGCVLRRHNIPARQGPRCGPRRPSCRSAQQGSCSWRAVTPTAERQPVVSALCATLGKMNGMLQQLLNTGKAGFSRSLACTQAPPQSWASGQLRSPSSDPWLLRPLRHCCCQKTRSWSRRRQPYRHALPWPSLCVISPAAGAGEGRRCQTCVQLGEGLLCLPLLLPVDVSAPDTHQAACSLFSPANTSGACRAHLLHALPTTYIADWNRRTQRAWLDGFRLRPAPPQPLLVVFWVTSDKCAHMQAWRAGSPQKPAKFNSDARTPASSVAELDSVEAEEEASSFWCGCAGLRCPATLRHTCLGSPHMPICVHRQPRCEAVSTLGQPKAAAASAGMGPRSSLCLSVASAI